MPVKRFAFHYEPLERSASARGVFSDPDRRRQRRWRQGVALLTGFFVVWVFLFFAGAQPGSSGSATAAAPQSNAASSARFPTPLASDRHLPEARHPGAGGCLANRSAAAQSGPSRAFQVFAHLPASLEWAHLSLEESCQRIDVLVPDWIALEERPDGVAVKLVSDDTRMPVEAFRASASNPPKLMPRVEISLRPFDTAFMAKLADKGLRARLVSDLTSALRGLGVSGACLDLDQFPQDAREGGQAFLDEMRSSLAKAGLRSCLIVSGNDREWMEAQRAQGFDHVIVKLFYEPWVGSSPSPLSENTWFLETAEEVISVVGPDRLVVALAMFGASWEAGVPLPRRLSYGEALAVVSDGVAELTFQADHSASVASFENDAGVRETIWLQDAASAFNQLSMLEGVGIHAVGIWSLGLEDPGLWHLLKGQRTYDRLITPELSGVMIESFVDYAGVGPALRVLKRATLGFRTFEVNPETDLIEAQVYRAYPTPYRLTRYGQPRPGEVVLTFDDGPHPDFTPDILEILQKTNTPAAFFLLGQNVITHPDIARQIVDAGHEIGTHSFSHPRMDLISASRTNLEHGMTERAIAAATGRTTTLYREPFLRSGGPISANRVEPLVTTQSRGQINYGMDVVPKDWLGLSSDEIVNYVIGEVEAGAGNVILLHDGGGQDRSASVEALPRIISALRARGYTFMSVASTLDMDRDVLMPPVSGVQPFFDRLSFAFASGTMTGLVLIFWVVLVIGLCRSLMILVLAACRRRHSALPSGPHPRVAVVIPAYNEEAAITKCLESVLASDYPFLEVVVVDDGSADGTLTKVLEFSHEPAVRVISHPNQGKWSALNRAILSLDADITVCIDADTQVAPDAIAQMAAHFQDPKVGAVAGKIVVGNRVNLLTRMQALEYVTAQNFERRAFDRINGILVVPGAIGAWRTSALRKAGLFCSDTLTEDCDVTIAVNRVGYRLVYDERAVAYTEAPQTLRTLLAQRLRWSLGIFQSAWKHKGAILEGRRVGYVSLPDMVIFGYLFPLLAPIADLFVLMLGYHLIAGSWSGDVGQAAQTVAPEMIWAYLALPALEFMIATYAVLTDRTAKKSLIFIWPFQRIFYRPILYYTVFRALIRAVSGTLATWGKTKRHGADLLHSEKVA